MVGDSVEHIEARFQQSQSESDLVILEGGINNIVRGEARHETDHDIIPPIVATERRMVAEAKRRNSKVMIVTVHPVTKRSLLHHFHSPFSFSVLPSHFDVARVNTLVLNLNKALTEMAWQEKIDLVDIHKALVASDGEIERTYVAPDGLHLSVFGYGVFAKTLAPFLKLASSGPSTERDLKDGGEH